MRFEFEPIGLCRSPYTDKFGIPRQPRLVTAAEARIELLPPYDREEAFAGLEGFSHVWLVFVFHQDCLQAGWRAQVRPPRLGGRDKVGVFASRSPYRPNPIGISAVAQHGLERQGKRLMLRVAGADLLDGTPILDIKPYVPYADAITDAVGGFANTRPEARFRVDFSEQAHRQMNEQDVDNRLRLRDLIEQVIAQDPRPGYMDRYPERREFALQLYDLEIQWRIDAERVLVTSVRPR
ncbi:MAG: tRNA (N6-threonylcarbamoyladenosine(37)-N6)-methyltransferase TrmO [Lamprobacter sp.]|uniref:tRNA (N6-threonylcarbamoyladenosine(37)-N6)-methyltransferase TrmO n=1 Tax=Lamprobacter sp. TaxID=3100796 RepID=UPI002B258622|nr:tRNA (N6-threonylcarbamoyladenosine(37)-N6)-methyltransferase TrmO [Lamprobacter sp.]MEA3639545.1 tRNA (N6-threonylcarbamoyladenosine(37)-N6)-methyltransferase TrmO [Lamprobacter sp.]